jgi:pilus assembly protein CpaB
MPSLRVISAGMMVLSIAIATFLAFIANTALEKTKADLIAARTLSVQVVPTERIYVAARPLHYGQKLTKQEIRAVNWPKEAIPEGAFFVEANDLFPDDAPDFRHVIRTMEAGEAILAPKVTALGAEGGVSGRLAAGQRAFAIQVDVQTGVSGLIRPGDRVDVYWTGQNGSQSGTVTRLIETALQIIAIDQSADVDVSKPAVARTITVQSSPQQVASLTQAQATGRLSLSLVGSMDETIAEAHDVDAKSLIGSRQPNPEPIRETRICKVTTRRAGEKVLETPIHCRN